MFGVFQHISTLNLQKNWNQVADVAVTPPYLQANKRCADCPERGPTYVCKGLSGSQPAMAMCGLVQRLHLGFLRADGQQVN